MLHKSPESKKKNPHSDSYVLSSSPRSPSSPHQSPHTYIAGEESKEEFSIPDEIKINIDDNDLDENFLEYLRKHKIKSILENVFSDTLIVNSFLSILTFANAARNFPVIRQLVYDALKKIIYYVCTLHEEVIKAIALEAATVGSEATGYTTTFMMTGSALLVFLLTYQGLKYPFTYSKKKAFQQTLEDLGLDPKIFNKYSSSISNKQIIELTHLIETKITDEKELVKALLSVYFDDLSDEVKLTEFSARVVKHKLKTKIANNLSVKPSRWRTFSENTEWYLAEIARYRIPLAALCAIPGVALMVLKSTEIGGANLSTLITDSASVADQANAESLEIYPWIFGSGPVIVFQALALFSYLATRPPYLHKLATGFYNKIHSPIEKWAKDTERWLYYDVGKQIILIPAIPAIVTYAGIKSLDFGERYAKAAGCESVGKVLKSIITDTSDPTGKCMTTTKANVVAVIVGDSEFDKFYLFYALLLVTYYPVMALIEKFSSLKEWLPREKAKKIYDEFKKINKNSYYFAGSVTVIAAWIAFFIARRFADHIPQEGIQVAFDLNDYITPNMTLPMNGTINNSTLPTVLKTICPNADLGKIISDALEKLPIPHNITELQKFISGLNITELTNSTFPDIPVKLINNSTVVAMLVKAAPEYGVFSFFLLNLLGISADCNVLLEYRTLAALVTLFWIVVSYTGGGSYSLGNAAQLLGWGVNAVKNWWQGESNDSEPEVIASTQPSEAKPEDMSEPLLPNQNQSEKEDKKTNWSGYCSSIYNFFNCKSLPPVNNTPSANPEYEPPSIHI
jgi:hypothetical protein